MRSFIYLHCFFDFATISFAVPIWAGRHPYEVLPMHFSWHVDRGGGTIEHLEFLDVSGEPPMRACAEAVVPSLGDTGPILTYTAYEKSVIGRMAAAYPYLSPALDAVIDRLVDCSRRSAATTTTPRCAARGRSRR